MGRKKGGSPFSLFSFQDIITCVSGIIILITLILAVELTQRKQAKPAVETAQLAEDIRRAIEDTRAEIQQLEAELTKQSSAAQEIAGAHQETLKADLFAINQQVESLEAELAEIERKQKRVSSENDKVQAKRFDMQKQTTKLAETEQEVKNLEDKLEQLLTRDRPIYNSRTADGKQVWLVQIEETHSLVAPAGRASKPQVLEHGGSLLSSSAFSKWLANRSPSADFIFFLVRPAGSEAFSKLQDECENAVIRSALTCWANRATRSIRKRELPGYEQTKKKRR